MLSEMYSLFFISFAALSIFLTDALFPIHTCLLYIGNRFIIGISMASCLFQHNYRLFFAPMGTSNGQVVGRSA